MAKRQLTIPAVPGTIIAWPCACRRAALVAARRLQVGHQQPPVQQEQVSMGFKALLPE
jgi:hypothetical protein